MTKEEFRSRWSESSVYKPEYLAHMVTWTFRLPDETLWEHSRIIDNFNNIDPAARKFYVDNALRCLLSHLREEKG